MAILFAGEARGGAWNQVLKGALVAVVAMGEIARSPRMLNHARELASHGFRVAIVGYRGRDFELPPGVRAIGIDGGRGAPPDASGLRFIVSAGLRTCRLFFSLLRVLLRERPRAILVQNPPSFPTLAAATLAARRVGATLTIDWHNQGFSVMSLRLGAAHWLVRAARWYEFRAGRGASSHFCVSSAMRDDLMRNAGIRAEVLYDLPLFDPPLALFKPACAGGAAQAPGFVAVCPAGWTADEDMEMLLDALELVDRGAVTVHITGDGVKRRRLAARLLRLRAKGVLLDTGFLPEAEYRDLVRRADLGLSLHRSSSGLDLAMKVVDLFGAGVPVCAFDYGGSIGEQIESGATGFLFRTAGELAALLVRLGSDPEALGAARRRIRDRWNVSWSAEWKRVALPILTAAS